MWQIWIRFRHLCEDKAWVSKHRLILYAHFLATTNGSRSGEEDLEILCSNNLFPVKRHWEHLFVRAQRWSYSSPWESVDVENGVRELRTQPKTGQLHPESQDSLSPALLFFVDEQGKEGPESNNNEGHLGIVVEQGPETFIVSEEREYGQV